jgi:hypothetical protein
MSRFQKLFLLIFLIIFSANNGIILHKVYAAKKRVFGSATTYVSGSYSSAKLSRGTNSVFVTFPNLTNVKKITYTLSYSANGIPQGAMGSVIPTGTSDGRDLYFGTCSKGVCTPHYNIKNAFLLVNTTLKSGGINVKKYVLKV